MHLLIHSFTKYLLSPLVCQSHNIILLVLGLMSTEVNMISRIPEVSFPLHNYLGSSPFRPLNMFPTIYVQMSSRTGLIVQYGYVTVAPVNKLTCWLLCLCHKNTDFKIVTGK